MSLEWASFSGTLSFLAFETNVSSSFSLHQIIVFSQKEKLKRWGFSWDPCIQQQIGTGIFSAALLYKLEDSRQRLRCSYVPQNYTLLQVPCCSKRLQSIVYHIMTAGKQIMGLLWTTAPNHRKRQILPRPPLPHISIHFLQWINSVNTWLHTTEDCDQISLFFLASCSKNWKALPALSVQLYTSECLQ